MTSHRARGGPRTSGGGGRQVRRGSLLAVGVDLVTPGPLAGEAIPRGGTINGMPWRRSKKIGRSWITASKSGLTLRARLPASGSRSPSARKTASFGWKACAGMKSRAPLGGPPHCEARASTTSRDRRSQPRAASTLPGRRRRSVEVCPPTRRDNEPGTSPRPDAVGTGARPPSVPRSQHASDNQCTRHRQRDPHRRYRSRHCHSTPSRATGRWRRHRRSSSDIPAIRRSEGISRPRHAAAKPREVEKTGARCQTVRGDGL